LTDIKSYLVTFTNPHTPDGYAYGITLTDVLESSTQLLIQ